MSSPANAGHAAQDLTHGGPPHGGRPHADPHHGHAAHGTNKTYMTGFILSVILTAIPFWLVIGRPLSDTRFIAVLVMALAVVQIVVHMVYFLHMSSKSEGGWTMLAMIFTVVLVFITLTGSIWIMYHLNTNMMPMAGHGMSPRDMSKMP